MRRRILFAASLSLVLLAGSLSAQGKPDLRVSVELNNGSTFRGIAMGGRLIEVRNRGFFRPAKDRKARNSGIRLWYYRDQDGFLFMSYKNIRELTVEGEVSAKDLKVLRGALSEAAKARKERRSKDGLRKEGDDALSDAEKALLAEFPPAQGWGPERYGEIHHKRVVADKELSEKEARFLKVYDEWREAWRKQRQAAKKPKGPETPTKKDDGKSEPAKRRLGTKPGPPPKKGFKGPGGIGLRQG